MIILCTYVLMYFKCKCDVAIIKEKLTILRKLANCMQNYRYQIKCNYYIHSEVSDYLITVIN